VENFQGYHTEGVRILDNIILNSGKIVGDIPYGGILLNYVDSSVVVSNTIDGSLYDGVRIYNSSYNLILGNHISNSGQANQGSGQSIVLEYQSTHNYIWANQIDDQACGIAEVGYGVDLNSILSENPVNNIVRGQM